MTWVCGIRVFIKSVREWLILEGDGRVRALQWFVIIFDLIEMECVTSCV